MGCKRHSFKSLWCVRSVSYLVDDVSMTRHKMTVPETYLKFHWMSANQKQTSKKYRCLVNSSAGDAPIPLNTSQRFSQLMLLTFLSNSVCHFRAPCPPHTTPAVCERRSGDSISCQPAGEPLLPGTSSRQPICLFNPPRGSHGGLLETKKKDVIIIQTMSLPNKQVLYFVLLFFI